MPGPVFTMIVIIVVLLFIISCIKIVPQAQMFVVEKLGTYDTTWEPGIHFLIPFFYRISKKVSAKEQVVDFKPQPVITKDNVTMQIDTVVFFQITDAKHYAYGVERPVAAIENLTATTLRNIVGDLELDQTLTSRDVINTKITATLDHATDRWGIKVLRVELKNILPPREIQEAMEKQMKAERERREKILQAEGEKRSAILVAEGEKESKILRAEGEKQQVILAAEADKERKRLEAEGEAASILLVQQAIADGITMVNNSNPTDQVIALKSLEAFAEAANGVSNTIVIPSEIASLVGFAKGVKDILQ
jgi:regulator of protease activity HflC (stomatin/prohibitin superfamily)